MKNIIQFIFFLSLLASSISFGSDNRLTKEEFLQRVDTGQLQLDRGVVFAVPDAIKQKIVEKQRLLYPDMRDDNLYYFYIRDNNFEYSLFWAWDHVTCELRIEELDKKTHRQTGNSVDPKGQKVEKKYCDKAYGRKL
jgi:hypothetical protein